MPIKQEMIAKITHVASKAIPVYPGEIGLPLFSGVLLLSALSREPDLTKLSPLPWMVPVRDFLLLAGRQVRPEGYATENDWLLDLHKMVGLYFLNEGAEAHKELTNAAA